MNRVYKSIWNAVTQTFTAVSENQKSRHKSAKASLSFFVTTLLMMTQLTANAAVHESTLSESVTENLVFGTSNLVNWNDSITLGVKDGDESRLTIALAGKRKKPYRTQNGSDLIQQSNGFVQKLVSNLNLQWNGDPDASFISIRGSDEGLFEQNINQGNKAAVGTYVVGAKAYEVYEQNKEHLKLDKRLDLENAVLAKTGVVVDGSVVSTLSFLTMLSYNGTFSGSSEEEDAFVITVDSGEATWLTQMTGKGAFKFVGNGKDQPSIEISNFSYDDEYYGVSESDYTGGSYFENITAKLTSDAALGNTNYLKLVNSNLNKVGELVVNGDVWLDDASLISTASDVVTLELSAQNFYVHNASSIGQTVTAKADKSFIFEGASGQFNAKIDAGLVEIKADEDGTVSNVEYSQNVGVTSENGTKITGGSSLTVTGTSQLGGKVIFENGGELDPDKQTNEYNKLTIKQTDKAVTGGKWTLGEGVTFHSSKENAIVIVEGLLNENGYAGETFTILDEEKGQWSDYRGWIRITDSKFEVENTDSSIFKRQDGAVGLSVGHGGNVYITEKTSIDRFGWANDSASGDDDYGVLDLTQFNGHVDKQLDEPILSVNELYMDGQGYIVLDPEKYINDQLEVTLAGSVLDYDDSKIKSVIASADKIYGNLNRLEIKQRNEGTLELEDLVEGQHKEALDNLDSGKHAADAYWGYVVQTEVKEDGSGDLYLGYALDRLDLVGGQAQNQALVINLSDAQDRTLSAEITGNGIIQVRYAKDNVAESDQVEFSNAQNSFNGAVVVDKNIQLTAVTGALGKENNKVNVQLEEEASLALKASQSGSTSYQYLQGLIAEKGNVEIGSNTQLVLRDSSILKGQLTGSGILEVQKTNLFTTADTLNSFGGEIQGTGASLFVFDIEQEKEDVLKHQLNLDVTSWLVKQGEGTLAFDFGSGRSPNSKLNIKAEGGVVVLDSQTAFGKIYVKETGSVKLDGLATIEELSGSGTINMELEFGSDKNKGHLGDAGDGLKVTGNASGNFALNATSKLDKGAVESLRVMEVDGNAMDFELALANGQTYVLSGAYDYRLVRTDQGTGAVFDLTSIDGITDRRNTSVTAGSYIGIAYAAQLFDLSLHDRVGNRDWINPVTGEKQSTSLWMHHTMSHERFRDSTQQLRMRTTSNTTMLGGDLVQFTTSETGMAYVGLMGGYGTMDTKTTSKVTNMDSKAETDAWGVGAYAGWKANTTGQIGPYVDGWVMFTHASSDVTGSNSETEDINGQGLSAQLEAGWGFKLGSVVTNNGKVANFTVEPHASVTWFGMEYDEIHNDVQDVHFEGTNNVRTRLGARAILTEEGNDHFNAFVEANWVHNTQEYGTTISGVTVDQAGSRNQGEARIGVDWRLTQDISAWARVGASFGSDSYTEREGSIGIRYQF